MEPTSRPMQLKDFTKIKLLGKGSYGSVYSVKVNATNEVIALKEMNIKPMNVNERKTALNEVRLLASIHHPHIIEYKFSFIENGKLYIGTELAANGDMDGLIRKCQQSRKYLDENQIWNSVAQICSGLKALHDAGIMHRDLKSSNILICNNGILKLADFGVARILKGSEYAHTNIGTPYYLSPEQWKDQPYNEKADMWSLGIVIYELVSLRLPFQGVNMNDLSRNVVHGQYPRLPSHASPEVTNLVSRLLVKNPKVRPSAQDVLAIPSVKSKLTVNHNLEIKLMDTIDIPGRMSHANIELPRPVKLPPASIHSAPQDDLPPNTVFVEIPRPPIIVAHPPESSHPSKSMAAKPSADSHKPTGSQSPVSDAGNCANRLADAKSIYTRQYGGPGLTPSYGRGFG
eukprot:TRINITY_DN2914_c0_g1_i6.p1 TRINITY_DN2914_c0_g1~~TRINITY_DN2914_c0_g1_i6.p1  ORF type:complete len:401 (+),score=86.36 TRINITY_DN2914_c0_g1_i6:71-1273(+)